MRDATEQVLVSKLVKESARKKLWIEKKLPRMFSGLQRVGRAIWSTNRLFYAINDRLSLSLRQTVFIIILTYVFGFVAFISYVRVLPAKSPDNRDILILQYGLPFEWLQVKSVVFPFHYVYDVGIVWITLAVDVILYFSLALVLVYGITRLRR
jgi:hypothetical protein